MKKQEIYVPIANKKEAKRAKAVLEAMGEGIEAGFYLTYYNPNNGGLYFNENFKTWCIAISFGGSNPNTRTKITLKQLIELLVSEQQAEPEKIAVRVDNKKEFNSLMKYYDSLGWKSKSGNNPNEVFYNPIEPNFCFNDGFGHSEEYHFREGYKIIPFSEFAKDHGIRVPLLVSEDGVELFEGDKYHGVSIIGGVPTYMTYYDVNSSSAEYLSTYPQEAIGFSTKQAALDWIEAQKPKEVEYASEFGIKCQITKDEALLTCGCGCFSITKKDITYIHKAMEDLNS